MAPPPPATRTPRSPRPPRGRARRHAVLLVGLIAFSAVCHQLAAWPTLFGSDHSQAANGEAGGAAALNGRPPTPPRPVSAFGSWPSPPTTPPSPLPSTVPAQRPASTDVPPPDEGPSLLSSAGSSASSTTGAASTTPDGMPATWQILALPRRTAPADAASPAAIRTMRALGDGGAAVAIGAESSESIRRMLGDVASVAPARR